MYIYADRWLRHVWNGKTWPRIRRSDENKTSNNFHAASPTISRLCALCALCVCVWRVLKQWNGPDARILLFFGQLYSGQHKQYKLHFAFVSESKDAGIQCEQHGQSDDCKKLYYSAWLALVGGKQWIFWSRLAACCRFSPLNFLSVLLSTVFVVVVVNSHTVRSHDDVVSLAISNHAHTHIFVLLFLYRAQSHRCEDKAKTKYFLLLFVVFLLVALHLWWIVVFIVAELQFAQHAIEPMEPTNEAPSTTDHQYWNLILFAHG